jgi:hypothetical protein
LRPLAHGEPTSQILSLEFHKLFVKPSHIQRILFRHSPTRATSTLRSEDFASRLTTFDHASTLAETSAKSPSSKKRRPVGESIRSRRFAGINWPADCG